METKALQVNVSIRYNFEEETEFAWISNFSEDGYRGRLTDCIYADNTPSDYTDWCVFAGTEGQCLIFRGLYNTYGEEVAFNYKKRLQEESYQRFLKKLQN